MPKVAIITCDSHWVDDDDYRMVINSITDWTEVSEEDAFILEFESKRGGGFFVLRRPEDEVEFIANTVASYLERVKKTRQEAEQIRLKNEAKKREKAATAEAKRREKELKKLAELKQKYEADQL